MSDTIASTDFHFPGQKSLYHGKVRDVYSFENGYMALVATDRISAFDVILPRPIPYKGQVLNQLAAHFLNNTTDILPNWLIDVPDPNVSLGKQAEPFKIEMVIRGSLVGYSWRAYQSGKRELCGVPMTEGMSEFDKFPEPIITPSTKAEAGHDEDISAAEIVKRGLATQQEFEKLSNYARALFKRGQEMARAQGLVLVDTKYEFGKIGDKIYLIDEIHTPDSSRYFYADSYDKYLSGNKSEPPKHLSKEFVREWLMSTGFSGQAGQTVPDMSDEFVQSVSDRYIELYEKLSGEAFQKSGSQDILKRIESNVTAALEKL